MKKIAALLLALVMLFSFAACDDLNSVKYAIGNIYSLSNVLSDMPKDVKYAEAKVTTLDDYKNTLTASSLSDLAKQEANLENTYKEETVSHQDFLYNLGTENEEEASSILKKYYKYLKLYNSVIERQFQDSLLIFKLSFSSNDSAFPAITNESPARFIVVCKDDDVKTTIIGAVLKTGDSYSIMVNISSKSAN